MNSILNLFEKAVEEHPTKIAIIDGSGLQTSFEDLDNRAKTLASCWSGRGVKTGDKVLVAMPVDTKLYASLIALWSLGATVVLPEPSMGLSGVRHAVKGTKPEAFCASGFYTLLKYITPALFFTKLLRPVSKHATEYKPATITPDDIALISFTSGTTGKPKGIPRSHNFLLSQYEVIKPLLDSSEDERDLVTFPVFTLINLAEGRTSILPNWKMSKLDQLSSLDLESWIEQQNATRALLPPALCEKLLPTTRLHTVFTGGGPVFPDAVQNLLGETNVICVYGSTEAEPIAHLDAKTITKTDLLDMQSGKGLLAGKPVPEVSVRIEKNEIWVSGEHVNQGYLDNRHDAENKVHDQGTVWHKTGDAGYLDEAGRLWLLGRIGTEVQIDDRTIYPFQIEVAARNWQGVKQCALITSEGQSALVIEGDETQHDLWKKNAKNIGIGCVKVINKIPMDARHKSKVDRKKLMNLL